MSTATPNSAATWPPGYAPPTSIVTSLDHSAWVAIATAIGLCVVLVFFAIRIYIRTAISPRFGLDDALISAATVCAVGQSAASFVAVRNGFGKSTQLLDGEQTDGALKSEYISEIIYLLPLYLSKFSVNFLLLRLDPGDEPRQRLRWILCLSIAFYIISEFIIAFRCDIAQPWKVPEGGCTLMVQRWQIVLAFDIITEVLLFSMCISLFIGLHMPKLRKFKVLVVFGFRLGMIPLAFFRYHYMKEEIFASDPSLHGTRAAMWIQISMSYSIIAGTIPCLQPFMKNVNTNFGAMGRNSISTTYGSSQKSSNGSHDLKFIWSRRSSKARSERPSEPTPRLPEDYRFPNAMAEHEKGSAGETGGVREVIKQHMHWKRKTDAGGTSDEVQIKGATSSIAVAQTDSAPM